MLKSQDIVLALVMRLVPKIWNYPGVSAFTGQSASQCHISCQRLMAVRLLRQDPGEPWQVARANLLEFLVHGLPYCFPVVPGASTRGIATAHAAPFLADVFAAHDAVPVVWPTMDGTVRGHSVQPLHACQMRCLRQPDSEQIYRALVDIDLLRIGQSRERAWAKDDLARLLANTPPVRAT
jgi:hypothetical protein